MVFLNYILLNLLKLRMFSKKIIISLIFSSFLAILLNSCGMGADARKYPPQPELELRKIWKKDGDLDLWMELRKEEEEILNASSNELWRASLDAIDFIPLASVNYSGGIIVTDWYSNNQNFKDSIKISIRFLTNEIRSDALDIKVFKKVCDENNRCVVSESSGELIKELKLKILKTAKIYEVQKKEKNFKPYDTISINK